MYGNLAKSGALRHLLITILDADLVQQAHVSSSLFDGTTVMAKASYEDMDRIDFRVESAFGCRWRSELYRNVQNEL